MIDKNEFGHAKVDTNVPVIVVKKIARFYPCFFSLHLNRKINAHDTRYE